MKRQIIKCKTCNSEFIEYISNRRKYCCKNCYNKSLIGHTFDEKTLQKLSESHKGYKFSDKDKQKMSEKAKGRKMSEEAKIKIGNAQRGKIMSKETIKKILTRRDKSSLEIKFENIINQLGLPYKFVGNGEVIVARKCPDFVNSNGEKIAVEVYYKKHKNQFREGLDIWKAERAKIFNENGWKIIFFDETQVNEHKVREVLSH